MPNAPLKLISSMATRDVLAELIGAYTRMSSQEINAEAGGGVEVAKRVQAGMEVDLVVLAANVIDKLTGEGKLLPGSRVDLVKSGIAVAVPQSAIKPDIGSEAAVKSAVIAAKSVSYSTGPSGVYLEKLFERWGILQDVKSKIVVAPPGVPVGSLVAKGEAQLGFQQLSELANVAGIAVLGSLPPEIQSLTTFSGGIAAVTGQAEAARRALEFIASPFAADIKTKHGMEPA